MKRRRDISIFRALGIFALGLLAGVQTASYLWDTFDDGQAGPFSGGVALVFVAVGLGFIGWSYRGKGE